MTFLFGFNASEWTVVLSFSVSLWGALGLIGQHNYRGGTLDGSTDGSIGQALSR